MKHLDDQDTKTNCNQLKVTAAKLLGNHSQDEGEFKIMPSKKLDLICFVMKELNKEALKQIAYNCRKATFLIEKKQIDTITTREKLELKIHLAGCAVCRIYEKQSIIIDMIAKENFTASQNKHFMLDDDFKQRLQARIERDYEDLQKKN